MFVSGPVGSVASVWCPSVDPRWRVARPTGRFFLNPPSTELPGLLVISMRALGCRRPAPSLATGSCAGSLFRPTRAGRIL